MLSSEFIVFSALLVVFALMSVRVKSVVSAVFCHFQTVLAVAGVLSGFNARFLGFSLLIMSASSLLVFLMFALIVFDFYDVRSSLPPKTARLFGAMLLMGTVETGWVFLSNGGAEKARSVSRVGNVLYRDYGFCPVMFGVLLLACMVGIASLLTKEEGRKP